MMYRTELVEGITVENVTEKINAKIEEMEKATHNILHEGNKSTCYDVFLGNRKSCTGFQKRVKG